MPKRRTLAFRNGIPQEKKSLVFTVALAAAVSACAHPQNMKPRQPTLREDVQVVCKPKKQQEDCPGVDVEEWFALTGESREKVHNKLCGYGTQVILTEKTLYIGKYEGMPYPFSDVEITPLFRMREMEGFIEPGVVGLTISPENIYLLKKDGALIKMPVGDMGEWLDKGDIPFDVTNAKITYHKGFVIVATSEHMVVASAESLESAIVKISLKTETPVFFECDGCLFFGDKKENVEIKIKGKRPDDVQVL